jgi:23S rRNA (uridine2552-2'-O)-methyltransferase
VKYERKDAHYRRAKAEGFRARSAYKLADLDDRHRLFRKGDRVVDLGAWPGGWLQVALDRIGPQGRVVAVDVVEIQAVPGRNAILLTGDVREAATLQKIVSLLGGPADVVLSDVAPKLTGVRDVDEARCAELVDAVIDALPILLKPDGRAVLKIFMDGGYQTTLARLRGAFRAVKTTRSEASRQGSAELYVVVEGLLCPTPPVDKL